MKKIYFLFFTFFFITTPYLSCQDIIVLKNGDEIKSKVLEITPNEIKYKKFDNIDGPTISILKTDVFMVKYPNGTKEVINNTTKMAQNNNTKSEPKVILEEKPKIFGVYFNPLGFIQFGPMLGVELMPNKNFIIDAHLRFSGVGALMYVTTENSSGDAPTSISGVGIGGGFKYYSPHRFGGVYIGPMIEFCSQTQNYYQNDFWSKSEEDVDYLIFMVNAGYKFTYKSGFFINTGAFLGFADITSDTWHYTGTNTDQSTHDIGSKIKADGFLELTFGFDF